MAQQMVNGSHYCGSDTTANVVRTEWQSGIALEFCERNDVEITVENRGLFTRYIMRRNTTRKYSVRTVPTYLLDSILPSMLFNTMLNEIIEIEKLV